MKAIYCMHNPIQKFKTWLFKCTATANTIHCPSRTIPELQQDFTNLLMILVAVSIIIHIFFSFFKLSQGFLEGCSETYYDLLAYLNCLNQGDNICIFITLCKLSDLSYFFDFCLFGTSFFKTNKQTTAITTTKNQKKLSTSSFIFPFLLTYIL